MSYRDSYLLRHITRREGLKIHSRGAAHASSLVNNPRRARERACIPLKDRRLETMTSEPAAAAATAEKLSGSGDFVEEIRPSRSPLLPRHDF